MTISTHAVVDTLLADPFRFLIAEPERPLPYAYAPDFCERLALYRRPPDAAHPAVRELALAAAVDSERDATRFPLALAQRIRAEFVRETRPEGPPLSPEATIAAGRGACRDLAVLFVACCQTMGLAARFASGYATARGRMRPSSTRGARSSCRAAAGAATTPARDWPWRTGTSPPPRDAAPVTATFRGTA